MDMTPFRKVVEIGSSALTGRVYVKIEYRLRPHAPGFKLADEDGRGRLSISGVEGPRANGDAKGSCGQIVMHMDDEYVRTLNPRKGWTREGIRKFITVWNRWHLNDKRAGSPRQRAYIEANPLRFQGASDWYANAVAVLTDAGLNPDMEYIHEGKPYQFGHAWLHEDVPADVIEYLRNLPDAEHEPHWV